jgi:Gpi18-like mannosyltransferase
MAAAALRKFGLPPDWAVLLASRLAAFLAIWGMLRLVTADYDERIAGRAVLFWLCWPMSFMLLAGYSEPFLVASMVWSLVFVRDERWWPAAICAVLACLSRSTGIALLPALYWLAWQRRPIRWAPLALASIGPFIFPLYLQLNRLALPSASYPVYWRTEAAAPWTTLLAAMRALASDHAGFVIFNLTAIVVITLLVFMSALRTEYKLIAGCMVLFLLTANTTPPLHSMMRYSLAIFPAFIALGTKARASWAAMLVTGMLSMVNLLLLFFFFDWAYIV